MREGRSLRGVALPPLSPSGCHGPAGEPRLGLQGALRRMLANSQGVPQPGREGRPLLLRLHTSTHRGHGPCPGQALSPLTRLRGVRTTASGKRTARCAACVQSPWLLHLRPDCDCAILGEDSRRASALRIRIDWDVVAQAPSRHQGRREPGQRRRHPSTGHS